MPVICSNVITIIGAVDEIHQIDQDLGFAEKLGGKVSGLEGRFRNKEGQINQLVHFIDTAEMPPIEPLLHLSVLVPNLLFILQYQCPNKAFEGTATIQNGRHIDEREPMPAATGARVPGSMVDSLQHH